MVMGWMKGQPLVTKVAKIAQYVVFPGTMAAALIYCPPESPKKNK
jgi:hypothetical protein